MVQDIETEKEKCNSLNNIPRYLYTPRVDRSIVNCSFFLLHSSFVGESVGERVRTEGSKGTVGASVGGLGDDGFVLLFWSAKVGSNDTKGSSVTL